MGERPLDFDEIVVKQTPTYQKWLQLKEGKVLRYSSRDFRKGNTKDEERLMRRINIARRNNTRDQERLKRARRDANEVQQTKEENKNSGAEGGPNANKKARRSQLSPPQDNQVQKKKMTKTAKKDDIFRREMDMSAVQATRSYKAWSKLEDGEEFTYGQKYCKGEEGHDWMLKKTIWRRMKYRRENQKLLNSLVNEDSSTQVPAAANNDSDQDSDLHTASTPQMGNESHLVRKKNVLGTYAKAKGDNTSIIEAAVAALAAAESILAEEAMKSHSR